MWKLQTESLELKCADKHIVFSPDLTEIYVKNLRCGDNIMTNSGIESVISCEYLGYKQICLILK